MRNIFVFFITILIVLFSISSNNIVWSKSKELPRINAITTFAPEVPVPVGRNYSAYVIVNFEAIEIIKELEDGVKYNCWTFDGSIPGKFVRVRQGDIVEFNFHNDKHSKVPHNIDLHAVTGPGGGAAVSNTNPGKTSVFSFKALNPGLFIYHCATPPVPLHIANGMYGLILVEPLKGFSKVDKEYYLVQSEFYTSGVHGEKGLHSFNQEKALKEMPDYVVFNGKVGSLVDYRALTADVGDKVRFYIGNGGPNLISSFHVIGAIFDKVYVEGAHNPNYNIQTTLIPAGGAAIVDFQVLVPGTYIIVDHSIFRAFNKGAIGLLKVTGRENKEVYASIK